MTSLCDVMMYSIAIPVQWINGNCIGWFLGGTLSCNIEDVNFV